MTFTGMGLDVPSPRLDPNCQCICHRQPGVMHVAACCQAKGPESDPADAIAARDAQMRAEGRVAGLREAATTAALNAWKHAGEDDYSRGMDAGAAHQVKACCDAIRALADKIEGDTVKAGGHYRECGE